MSTATFGGAAAPVSRETTAVVPADAETTAVATTGSHYRPVDIEVPFLRLIPKTGKLSDAHPRNVGEFLINDDEGAIGSELTVAVLGDIRFWQEARSFDDDNDEMPGRFDTVAAFQEAGFQHFEDVMNQGYETEKEALDAGEKFVIDAVRFCLAVFHEDGQMCAPDGSFYDIVYFNARKGGFKKTYVPYNTWRRKGRLKDDKFAHPVKLVSKLRIYGKTSWYAPEMTLLRGETLPEGFVEDLKADPTYGSLVSDE